MTSKLSLTFVDYAGKTSDCGIHFPDLNAGNITAQMGLMDGLRDAIEGVSIGNLQTDSRLASETKFAVSNPSDPYANRQIKYMVRCVEANGNPAGFEIPCADLQFLSPNSDNLDTTTPEGTALVSAINAGALSNDGEAMTFVDAVVVGRSL